MRRRARPRRGGADAGTGFAGGGIGDGGGGGSTAAPGSRDVAAGHAREGDPGRDLGFGGEGGTGSCFRDRAGTSGRSPMVHGIFALALRWRCVAFHSRSSLSNLMTGVLCRIELSSLWFASSIRRIVTSLCGGHRRRVAWQSEMSHGHVLAAGSASASVARAASRPARPKPFACVAVRARCPRRGSRSGTARPARGTGSA